MPQTAAQQLDDAYPQPQGGLRAFFQSTAVSTSGLDNAAQETCTGIGLVSGYGRRTGAPGETSTVRYMTTWNNTLNSFRLYRMDGTNGETTWTKIFTGVTTADNPGTRKQSSFVHFVNTAGEDYTVVVVRTGLESSDRGLYKVRYIGGTLPQAGDAVVTRVAAYDGPVVATQARIVIGGTDLITDSDHIYWTDAGDITFSGTTHGSLVPQPQARLSAVRLLAAFDPDQIVVGFQGAPWVTITGDINSASTPVRAMGDGHYVGASIQDAVRTPSGIIFMEKEGSAYLTDGRSFSVLTPQLDPFSSVFTGDGILSTGNGTYLEGFAFLPGGLCMHEESKGWFHISEQLSTLYSSDPQAGVLSASKGIGFTLRERDVSRGAGVRNTTYTWRSAPFAQPDGTQTEVREVQVDAQVYSNSTFAITVTDHAGNATTITTGTIAAGRRVVAVPILVRGQYADVKIVASNSSTGEAPTIERVRIGFGHGHQL